MPLYEWQGRDLSGQPTRGTIYAETVTEAQERLREQGIHPTLLRPIESKVKLSWWSKKVGARPSVLAKFFHDLYQSVRSGVPLTDALETLANEPTPLATVARHAAKRISIGVPLSQALAETGFGFQPYVIPLIQAGERSGQLDTVLGYLSEHFRHEHRVWLTTWAVSVGLLGCYIGCLTPVLLIVIFVLPKVVVALSPNPQWSLWFYERMFSHTRYLLWGIVAFLGLYLFNWFLSRNPKAAIWWDNVKMRLPLIGLPQKRYAAARFGRVLAMLYSAGISPAESLILSGQASGSLTIAKASRQQAENLKRGAKLSTAVASIPFIPPTFVHAIAAAEKTGRLDEGLNRAAELLELEAQTVQTAKPFALTAIYYGIIILALVALIVLAWWAFAGFYQEMLKWTEQI